MLTSARLESLNVRLSDAQLAARELGTLKSLNEVKRVRQAIRLETDRLLSKETRIERVSRLTAEMHGLTKEELLEFSVRLDVVQMDDSFRALVSDRLRAMNAA